MAEERKKEERQIGHQFVRSLALLWPLMLMSFLGKAITVGNQNFGIKKLTIHFIISKLSTCYT